MKGTDLYTSGFDIGYLRDLARNPNAVNPMGRSFLHDIAQDGDVATAELLYDAGADIDLPDIDGKRPLHEAAFSGQRDMAAFLLDCGADVNARTETLGHTPLALAVAAGFLKVSEDLIARGARLHPRDLISGYTPLHLAAGNGDLLMIGVLVKAGADPFARCFSGEQPVDTAQRLGQETAVRVLDKVMESRIL